MSACPSVGAAGEEEEEEEDCGYARAGEKALTEGGEAEKEDNFPLGVGVQRCSFDDDRGRRSAMVSCPDQIGI